LRCVLQRVLSASVTIDGETISKIGKGILALLGVEEGDTKADLDYMVKKIPHLRIFEDENGKMNLSLLDVGGELLLVSQFTLLGDARHGRRPSFIEAARPEDAEPLFEAVAALLRQKGLNVQTGRFRTHMEVSLLNDGPVTILLDSRKVF